MAEISELIAKLEGLSEPSREVDLSVAEHCGVEVREYQGRQYHEPCPCASWTFLPEYTASLDAAVALVERKLPGWRIEMRLGDWPLSDPRRVTLWSNDTKKRASIFGFSADAPTPAIALCLALLRALSSEQGDD